MVEPAGKKIVINPVTRIEGHARITLFVDDGGKISDARFHVNEFRGFEKFCEGRLFTEMPNITPRICGICPVSHAVASAKAGEMIMGIRITPAAERLRRLIQLGQLISSHALSFFHLSAPDLLLGWDADPAERNILGIASRFPDLARRGIRLRKFGQEISERITGKKVHAIGIATGGMIKPLSAENRQALLDWIPEVLETTFQGLEIFKRYLGEHREEVDSFALFDSIHLGLVGPGGEHELYDGGLRFVDAAGNILEDQLDPARYLDFIAERPVEWSYLKYPYFKPAGYPGGFYRVGPLSRLNVASRMKTPKAQKEFETFRALSKKGGVQGNFYFHYARLIEIITAVEQCQELLGNPDILSSSIFVQSVRNFPEGVGCTESPRGTLFHHYEVDESGILTRVNLLIATGQNNPSMNRAILDVSRRYVDTRNVKESSLNRVEAAIRCFDPCLSCSTHAIGSMPLVIEIVNPEGRVLQSIRRGQ